MQNFSTSPKELIASIWRNRSLIQSLTQRDVIGRYRGSFFGILWSFFNPVLMLLVYTFVFSVVFKARWSADSDSKTEFALVLFAGLIVFNFFAECVSRAPNIILSNTNYVKKVVFPLEILPVVVMGSAVFHASISILVWLLAYSFLFGVPHVTVFMLPLILVPLLFLVIGLSWILAALGVYIRDISQFVGVIVTILMFLSPIFYPAKSLPNDFQILLLLNPLTTFIEDMRNLLFFGVGLDLFQITRQYIISLLVAYVGFVWFQKTRKGFADVL